MRSIVLKQLGHCNATLCFRELRQLLLIGCLSCFGCLLVSCSEEDDTVDEFDNWQAKNEAYFEQQYQQHVAASSATCFVLKSFTKGDSVKVADLPHTDCILVDVLPSDFPVVGDKTKWPIYTDVVDVHYRGNLLPSVSFPAGYSNRCEFPLSVADRLDKGRPLRADGDGICGILYIASCIDCAVTA